MFANTMKILTLTTTNTATVPLTNATVNTKQQQQPHSHQHNNKSNNNNMQERRSSSPKVKSYINGNSNSSNNASSNVSNKTQMITSHQQQQQQQHQQQKYNHNKNSKKQHHANYNGSNNNNNSTNNTNRKKYYQQHNNYHNNHNSNNNYNNNNNLMKNQNVDLILCTPTAAVLKHNNNNNNQNNSRNNGNNINKNYNHTYEQQQKQQQQQHHHTATTSTLTGVTAVAAVKSNFLKTLATQSPTPLVSNNNTTTITTANNNKNRSNSNCLSCWTSFTKLQQQKQQQGNTMKTKTSPATSTTPSTSICSANSSSLSPSPSASPLSSSSGDLEEFVCKSKSSISNTYTNSARQASWKVSGANHLATPKSNNNSTPNKQKTASTAGLQKVKSSISNNRQSAQISANIVVDNKGTIDTAAATATTTKKSTPVVSAMTTALATVKVTATNVKRTNEKAADLASSTTSTSTVDDVVTTTTAIISAKATIVTSTVATTLNTVATTVTTTTAIMSTACTSSSTAATSARPTSPNSYSLDFLHSVGAQMTDGANTAALKTTSMSNMRATTAVNTADYNNHKSNADQVHQAATRNAYNYSNVRYMASGSSSQNYENVNAGSSGRNHHYHQHQPHYNHYYHQPQQLTIASFIQKDLLAGTSAGGSSSNSSSTPTSNANQPQQQHRQNYHNQPPRFNQNYYQPHYQQLQQQQKQQQQQQSYTATPQHAYNAVAGENIVRLTGNGGSGNIIQANNQRLQQNRAYQPYHNNNKGSTNVHAQQQQRNMNNNNNINANIQVKKSNFNSSSSSSSSVSSLASNSSQNSAASGRVHQNKNKTSSNNMNSQHQHQAIETLPTKINHNRATTQQRSYHSYGHGQYSHPHYQQQHHYYPHNQNHHSINVISASEATTPTTPQHQNFYNLTYVNTEMLPVPTTENTVTATTLSPQPPAVSPLLINSCPGATVSYYQYGNFVQPHTHFINNKKVLPTFTLNVPPPTISQITPPLSIPPTPTPPPLQPANILCCAQLDEAATAAAASTSASNTLESLSINTSNDYDSDSSATSHSTASSSRRHQKYQHMKSVSISSSSSTTSSAASLSDYHQIATAAPMLPPTTPLHSPIDFAYGALQTLPQQQYAPHQYIATQQPPHISISPQHVQQHYNNGGFISLLTSSVGSNNSNILYTDDDATTPHANVPHIATAQQFYFTTNDHFNGNVGTAYWSPLPSNLQHSNFVYTQAAANMLASTMSCSDTRTPSLSPRPSEQLEDQYSQQQHLVSTSDYTKRSTNPPATIAPQQQCMSQPQAAPDIAATSLRNVAATTVTRGRLNQQHLQSSVSISEAHHQTQQQISSSAPPSLPPAYQHNLLCNNPSSHLRSSHALNAPHSHDFSSHTPPDRFLARSHLIEAKEAPSVLLNNTKWDSLSQGIWNKFIQNQQTERTFKQKMFLWRHLYIIVKNTYQRFGLYMVGSTISGFGADNSDVDMCLVSRNNSSLDPRTEALCNLNILRDYLSKTASVEFGNFNLIEAKVPILRFTDCTRQLEVDLNFNNSVGIKNTHLLHCYSQLDWRLKPLVLVTKLWAQYHNINNAKNMTISSYSLALMVIHFLQYAVNPPVLPCLHDIYPDKFTLLRSNDFGYIDMIESIDTYDSKNMQTIGELFLQFLEYYSCFDFTQHAISVRTGGLLPINVCRQAKSLKNDMHQWKELCIEEPFDLTNTARSVYDFETFERVKSVFVASWHILQETLDFATVFTPIIVSPLQMTALLHPSSMASPVTTATATSANVPVLHEHLDTFKNARATTIAATELENQNESSNAAASALVIVSRRTTQELTGTSLLMERDINFHKTNISSTNNARNNNSSSKNLTAIAS